MRLKLFFVIKIAHAIILGACGKMKRKSLLKNKEGHNFFYYFVTFNLFAVYNFTVSYWLFCC